MNSARGVLHTRITCQSVSDLGPQFPSPQSVSLASCAGRQESVLVALHVRNAISQVALGNSAAPLPYPAASRVEDQNGKDNLTNKDK
jgi:hypothetical protein